MRKLFSLALVLTFVGLMALGPQLPAMAAVKATTCDTNIDVSASSATTANLAPIPVQGTMRVHVCSIVLAASAADVVSLVTGTGSTCTTPTTLFGPITMGVSETVIVAGGVGDVLVVPAGQALCLTTTTSGLVGGNMMIATY